MSRVKITEGAWKGQEGELVSEPDASPVLVRMPGNRLVEFAPERVDLVLDEDGSEAE